MICMTSVIVSRHELEGMKLVVDHKNARIVQLTEQNVLYLFYKNSFQFCNVCDRLTFKRFTYLQSLSAGYLCCSS